MARYRETAVNDGGSGGSKYSQLADNARANNPLAMPEPTYGSSSGSSSSSNYPKPNQRVEDRIAQQRAEDEAAAQHDAQDYSWVDYVNNPVNNTGNEDTNHQYYEYNNPAVQEAAQRLAEQRAAEQRALEEQQRLAEQQRQAELAEQQRQAQEAARLAQEARQEAVDTAQAEVEEKLEQPSSSYMPYGDPRQTAENPFAPTPTRIARYAGDYPAYTGEQPELYGQRNRNADYYRGRELMQPVYTTAQQTKDAQKFGARMTADEAEDQTEFYTGPTATEAEPTPVTNPLAYRVSTPGLPSVGPGPLFDPMDPPSKQLSDWRAVDPVAADLFAQRQGFANADDYIAFSKSAEASWSTVTPETKTPVTPNLASPEPNNILFPNINPGDVSTAGVNVDASPFTGTYTPSRRYNPAGALARYQDMNGVSDVADQVETTTNNALGQVRQLQYNMRPDITNPDDVVPIGSSSKRGTYPYDRYGNANTPADTLESTTPVATPETTPAASEATPSENRSSFSNNPFVNGLANIADQIVRTELLGPFLGSLPVDSYTQGKNIGNALNLAGKVLEYSGRDFQNNVADSINLNAPIIGNGDGGGYPLTDYNNNNRNTDETPRTYGYTDDILNSYANATGRALEDMDESDYRAMRDLNREATAVAEQARFNALANGDVRNIPPQDLVGMLGEMTDPTYAQELEQQYQRFKGLGMNDRQISAELYRRAADHMNPLARATDAQGNLHYDFALAGSGVLPEDMAIPTVDANGNGNAAFNEFANSVDYFDDKGNTIYRNPDGTFTEIVPKADGTVERRKYNGEVTSTYHYTPDQVLSMYVNPNGGRNGEPTWRGLDAVFEGLTPEERAGMEELLANFVGGGDLNRLREGFNRESTGLTEAQYERLAQLFLNKMPAIQNLIDRGVLSERDVANFFFKAPSGSGGSGSGSGSGGSGSGYSRGGYTPYSYTPRSYGSGGSGSGGSGYSGGYYNNNPIRNGSGNSTPSTASQRQNRVYNIMKNWSF